MCVVWCSYDKLRNDVCTGMCNCSGLSTVSDLDLKRLFSRPHQFGGGFLLLMAHNLVQPRVEALFDDRQDYINS